MLAGGAAGAGAVGSSPNASSNENPDEGAAGLAWVGLLVVVGVSPNAESKSAKLGSTS